MRQLTPKRLTAWLLTLVMALSLLPAAALADEVDDDLSPPAPQEDYGYVRLVFAEGEQLDLYHGEYITECSPTAAVHDGADEDFLTDGDYLALYYEGRLYHKATLDGVRIDADAVLPAEDFALVPMGELAAQEPPSGAEPVALTTEETTTEPTEETTTEPTGETTTEPTGETTTEPAGETTTEPTGEGQPAPEVRKAPQRAAGDKYGFASFQFRQDGVNAIHLHSGEYINECVGGTVPTVWQSTTEYPDIYDFIRNGDYKALHYHGFLYLKGELDLHGANINVDMMKLGFGISPKIYVKEDAGLYNSDSLIYSYDTGVEIFIPTGKKLELNAVFPGVQKYPGAIRVAGEVTITGGGRLDILYTLINTESGIPRTLFGIYGGEGVTLRGNKDDGTGPTVNIKMDSGAFGPEANDVVGIWSGGDLIIQDDSKVKIEMLGHRLGQTDTEADVNWAIHAKRLELLNNASLEILSHKNVIHDIFLTAESGDVLKVDTTGFLNIRNKGNIQRYDAGTWQHLQFDYPKSNIHLFKGTAQGARVNIIKAEQGVKIESFSSYIDDWYKKLNDPEKGNWNWAISGGADPALGTNMYRGNRRIDNIVQVDDRTSIYTWGSMEYIYEPQGVATVQKSRGLVMKWETPEGASSSVYFAKVLEPEFNDIHVVRKGESIELTTTGTKGTFLYWYDALHPEGSTNGTSWKNLTQKFTNIQRDMVLVPVYDPMKNGPTLSDVGYSVQWDDGVTKQTRYAYQDLTFEKVDNISNGTGGYEVMLVPAQLPRYGVKNYAAKDLKNRPVMNLRNSRLYADVNASFAEGTSLDWINIPTGSYRIAYNDDATGSCFFSKPFTFDPPVAPPYISPDTKIYDTGGTKQVTITAERGANIWYSLWDYTKNTWGGYNLYNGPFDVDVTADQDVRIEAYAGNPILDRRSEVRYAVRPTGVPEVKYGGKVLSTTEANLPNRYFYGSIELTVEAPEGYEVWYNNNQAPYETSDGIVGIPVEGGKVTLDYSGEFNFKLAKVVTVDGQKYRRLSHSVTKVKLVKQDDLPVPKVTVKTKEGGQTLTPSGPNTYTMTENVVTVTLESTMYWPLNATIAYDTNGNATPRLSTSYTKPFDVRGAGTISVFTLVPKANGGYDYERKECTFKLAESLQTVQIAPDHSSCTVYYMKEDGTEAMIPTNAYSQALKVGTRVRVVPNTPTGKVFKKWEISNYDEYNIWGAYGGNELYNPELIFHVPKPKKGNYGDLPLRIEATFASAAEASISGQTLVGLDMSKTVGDSISLWYTTKDMRTISYQWWEGASVGADDEALLSWVTFDPDKTYTVKVTIKANPGACFTTTAGVGIGSHGGHFTVPDDKIDGTYDTLTFTATPIRQIDLTMPAPLTVGDPLPTAAQIGGLPAGVTVQELDWPYTSGTTVPDDDSVRAALTLKTDGTRPILVDEYKYPTVNGVEYVYARNSSNDYVTDGSTVMVGNIDLPVKSNGVSVSGKVLSYNPGNATTIQLMQGGAEKYSTTIDPDTGSGQKEQNFSFDAVAKGTYDLVVTKPGHLSYTVKGVVVGDTAINLTAMEGKPYQTITLLCGDIVKNGYIDFADYQELLSPANYGKKTTDTGVNALADLNGNGYIDFADYQILLSSQHYGKSAVSVNFGE